jgi:hypothetical protein
MVIAMSCQSYSAGYSLFPVRWIAMLLIGFFWSAASTSGFFNAESTSSVVWRDNSLYTAR